MSEIKLTVKQEKFANLFVEFGNASKAYREAYSCEKMSDNSIHVNASQLLATTKVTLRVKQLQAEAQKRSDISKDEAILALANIVRANVLDYVDISDNIVLDPDDDFAGIGGQSLIIKNLSQLTAEQQRCIKSITPVKDGIKLELYDKTQAIGSLRTMLGWDEATKMETTIKGGVDIDQWIKERAE